MTADHSPSLGSRLLGILFHYETVKIVDIKNKKVGALYRFIQLIIIGYVVGYVIVYKKGYQEFDTPISSVTSKLKGTSWVNFTNSNSTFLEGVQVYDSADYVIPPQESNGFFVMTNMIITPNQTRSTCAEDPRFKDNHCKHDSDCVQYAAVPNGNGVKTGKCISSDRHNGVKVCEIYGWCPVELDELPMPGYGFSRSVPLLAEAENFTVLVKNQISFPKFKFQRRNIVNRNNSQYLKKCHYHRLTDKLCPIFSLGGIVREAEGRNFDFNNSSYFGAIYGIIIHWDCDLDHPADECSPQYSFRRLDDPNAPISPGYNFRYSTYYVVDGRQYRILTKAYGLKFEVLVSGKAGKFSVVPLFTNLGAGLALLGIASVWCDIIVMYCLKKRKVYKDYKYQRIEDEGSSDEAENVDNHIQGGTDYKRLPPGD